MNSVGTYRYLISDNVNIRMYPSVKSTIIATLPIASRLKILKSPKDREAGESYEGYHIRRKKVPRFTYNNIIYDWYKVSFINNNIEDSGYVVGAFIADKHYISSSSPSLIFLSSISKYYPEEDIVEDQIRIVKNNQEIDRIDFFGARSITEGGNFLNLLVRENKEINKGINIIQISYTGETCGKYTNEITFFFDNEKLYHIRTFDDSEWKYLGFNNRKIQVINGSWIDSDTSNCYYPETDEFCDKPGCCVVEEIIEEYIWDGRMLQRIDAYRR